MDEQEFLDSVSEGIDAAEEVQVEDNQSDVVEEESQEVELDLSPMEQKAFDQGWRPQEDFNGPEDHWKTAKEYVKDGEWLAKIKEANQRTERLEQSFNERLENTNKLNEAKNKADIAALKKQQREAVNMADEEAYDSAQQQIDDIEAQPVEATPTTQQVAPAIQAWEESNPWRAA